MFCNPSELRPGDLLTNIVRSIASSARDQPFSPTKVNVAVMGIVVNVEANAGLCVITLVDEKGLTSICSFELPKGHESPGAFGLVNDDTCEVERTVTGDKT